jgi:hypothetical protein
MSEDGYGSQYGQPPGYSGHGVGLPQGKPPPSYLPWAIVTTILCCLPAGVVSIVYAAQVNGKWMAGDAEGAWRSSKNAKTWAIVSGIAGPVTAVLLLILANVTASTHS